MKSNLLKSIFISLILVMGVNNAWAVNHTGGYIYFLKPSTWSQGTVMMWIGHSTYTSVYTMTKVNNTDNLYRYSMPSWGGANYVTFANVGSAWNSGNFGSGSRTSLPHYTNVYNNYGYNSGSYYVHVPASTSNNAGLTINYTGTTASSLNLTTRANVYGSTDGSTYTSNAAAGTVSVSGYYMSNYSTASARSAVSSNASNAYASTTLAPGSTAKFTATAKTGYEFVGWFSEENDGTAVSTSTTYNYAYGISYTGKTLYARFDAISYSITYKDQGGDDFSGTHASGYPTTHTYSVATTLKNPTKAGYTFGGWFTNSDCTGTAVTSLGATDYTANITLYAKWTQNATYSLEVQAGTGIASVTGSTDPVTLGNSYPITATPETGYSFSTWTANPAANATFGSAETAETTVTVKNGSVTVTATATENMSTLTTSNKYDAGNPGYEAPTASVNSIGYETTATVTATAAGNGYTFTGWTLTNCTRTDGGAADATSITVRSNGDSKAATVVANYAEDLTSEWHLVGNGNIFPDGWNVNNNSMMKKISGKSTESIVALKVNVTTVQTYEFKIVDDNGSASDTWYGYSTGNTFLTWTATSTKNVYSGDNNANNLKFTPNVAGEYEFKVDYSGAYPAVTITYPTAYKITYGVGTNKGTDAVTTNPNIKSGASVLASTEITFSKGDTKAGYTWKNWNSEADGTGTNLGTGETYVSSNRTGDISVYACYDLNTYNITYNLDGGTGATNTTYNVESATITLPTNPTKTGYTFDGWYFESDFSGTKQTQIAKGSTGNKEFWAKWTANKYTVKFNANGGEGEMADQDFTYDDAQNLTENAFTRTNALFVGWATSEENAKNGVVAYTNGESVSNLTTKDGIVNLYAVWATISITACPERIKLNDQLTLTISYKNIPENYIYRVYITNHNQPVPNNNGEWITISGSGTLTHTSHSGHYFTVGENNIVVDLYNQNHTILLLRSEAKTFIAEQIGTIAVYTRKEGEGDVLYTNLQNVSASFGVSITAPTIDGYRFDHWEEISGGIVFTPDTYSSTVTVTASNGGQIRAYYKKLEPKTIYLKTVEGTTDGYKWYIKYGGQEDLMDELGCTGEYYRGVVPEQTEFQLIAKDNGGNIIAKETRDGLVVPDNSNMLNLVSVAASGDKIFFKPNQQWVDEASNNNYYFAGRFWTGSAVWKEMTDDNGDGIYECEKPTNGNEVIFCLVNNTDNIENWGDNLNYKQIQTNGDNTYKQIPNGSNLFTITDNKEDQATGTWSEFADTPVNGEGEWTIFEGATYRITFNHEGAESGTTTPGVAYVDAQHNSAMPVIELESLPKNTNWKFGGYYTAADGETAITNAFGDWLDADGYISNGKWVKEECVTLHAHWVAKTPEITNVELSKNVFDVGSTETTTATPTVVEYSYQGDFTICWKLLDNSGTVMESFPFTPGDNNSVSFSVDGLTSGTYTVRASIYASSACDTGEELSRFDAKITIVSGYKVTVKYLCGDNVIKASDIAPGHATTPMDITAPEIGGYKFVKWELGDGIFSESDLNSQTISYTAIYDGYLTAKYEKKKLIFLDLSTLPNKDKWTEPHIYLYNSNGYWDDAKGAGATGSACVAKGGMTKVPNTENIWYYDYESVNNFGGTVAFTATNKMSQQNFWDCEAIYRTDFSSGTPVFVPASDQTAETKNSTAKYYSKGYWVKYMDGTGYWMIIYNEAGDKELVRREFTSDTQRMTMTSIVDLEAEHTYQYEIYRNDGYYYKGGDITYTNSSTYRPLNEANKHSIKTTETGDYTFTLDYSKGDLQIKVQYPGEVGDYRILYTDNVREERYKPSQIISQNNEEPLVSFFVRPNNNPVLKIQKAMLVTEDEVIWDNVLYLKPNNNWKADGARFAAYFYNNSGNTWVSMTSINNGEYYGCAIPTGTWTHVIFCRMNPNIQENRWNQDSDGDNKPVWNQTGDLTIPTNGNNLFTIPSGSWNGATKTWSKRNDIIDLSNALKEKLRELDLTNIKANEGSVFNIHLSNNSGTPTIEKVALYTGNYYIRVDAVDGKWYDYKTNPDNLMTYSAFSESDENSFGEKFSHYKTKWCSREKGDMNVKFVIANDYSLCISDTLTQDEGNPFGNIDTHGNITNDGKYDANIRFMWNRHTNKVSRAYVAGASGDNTRFLVLKANRTIQNESGQSINNNEVVFKDTQNWLYERTIKVQPGTLVKLIAYYPDENKAQYFRGTDANEFVKDVSAVQILGGNNSEWYTMRIIYDFKTNRLMAAWVPDQNINGTLEIDADIMVIRQHQEDATYITFANDKSQLSEVKTVYGVMRFNRWTLNNRSTSDHKVLPVQDQKSIYERALYFISFPFDVHLSDVFGFGTYGTHWVISEYNGLRRATNGYFIDNCMNEDCTNWDYIWDPSNFTMNANQGYLLSLDLDLMKHDNESFWAHDIQQVELFFPSNAPVQTIQQTSYTMPALGEEYICKHKGHEVLDTYWRCIGVPSFADYNSALTTDGTDKITWKPKGSDLPYLYEWNVSDNSLMVRAASTYRFRSTYAYLVQNGGEIHWSAVNATPNQPSNIVARRQAPSEINNYEWKLTLSRNEQVEDQAFVRLSDNEQITTEFDFNQDLSKEFNYGRSDIYTLIGYEKAAANSLPLSEQTTLIPLGLSIEYNGDYTIAMPDRMENIGVTLVDTESNTRTNLSAGMEYVVTLNKGDYNNRFFIEISPIQQTPTDIEYVTGDSNSQDSVRKVLIDNILYIVRDGQMFDARGARVK